MKDRYIPEWATTLYDFLLERLPSKKRADFADQFGALSVAVTEWQRMLHEFQVYLLRDEIHFNRERFSGVAIACDAMTELHCMAASGEKILEPVWLRAHSAAITEGVAVSRATSAAAKGYAKGWSEAQSANWSEGMAAVLAAQAAAMTLHSEGWSVVRVAELGANSRAWSEGTAAVLAEGACAITTTTWVTKPLEDAAVVEWENKWSAAVLEVVVAGYEQMADKLCALCICSRRG